MRPSKTYFKSTVPDAVFCASRNTVLDGVLLIGRRFSPGGEHTLRLRKNGVYLEHELENGVRLGPSGKLTWPKRSVSLEGTI
jgi:hypothetical protein